MQKLGLLTVDPHSPIRPVVDVAGDSDLPRRRKNGLLSYSSDQPYRTGRDVILARWGETSTGHSGRTKPRKIGLLTLS
jgi:hypothetical protein